MRKPAFWLFSAGLLLLIGVLASQGLAPVLATLATAGWGLLLVALFHLLPLWLDAAAIRVLFEAGAVRRAWREALLARWVGESANSLMPLGQVAGPVAMARHLSRRGMATQTAAAAITVSTTLQALAQFGFGLVGVALLALPARFESAGTRHAHHAVIAATLTASVVLALILVSFYLVQRRGLFGGTVRRLARVMRRRDWSGLLSRADAIDVAVEETYGRGRHAAMSFALSLAGWLVGSGEVYLALRLLGSPVGWRDALLLESLGQAIRGAAFAIPGALGVQEGGYLLLAPFAGLTPDAALALSFAKRAREIVLGVPGLIYLHHCERTWRRSHSRVEDADSGRVIL
ncbi:MAG TPA: lysylphosphatidylglycerol synthase domain-containing protein [Steroidobacteraceae bacterium]|jgi:putative membrane protein|nr:lysylphosphatidylglycerol synthase domain-containing protein [Steroidobacteraceae bacterium]